MLAIRVQIGVAKMKATQPIASIRHDFGALSSHTRDDFPALMPAWRA
jgi:hypothetical protein